MSQNLYFITIYILAFLATYAGVNLFRRWSMQRGLFDVPNERSSHTVPTPRGGGIVIVLVCLLIYSCDAIFISKNFSPAYVGGSVLIAFISWLDDLFDVSFLIRIFIHSLAAFLIVYFVGYFEYFYLPFFGEIVRSEYLGMTITFLWIIWLTNAFNFMDGIDGIAGMQTLTAGIGWVVICLLFNLSAAALYAGVIASAGFGFLLMNWEPAKIFMGDVGSAFLGFSFAILPLLVTTNTNLALENSALLPILAIVLSWFFVFDTIFTFIKRILRKEKVWKAHRSHLYQQMVIAGLRHKTVTIIYGLLSALIVLAAILRVRNGNSLDSFFAFTTILLTGVLFTVNNLINKRPKELLSQN